MIDGNSEQLEIKCRDGEDPDSSSMGQFTLMINGEPDVDGRFPLVVDHGPQTLFVRRRQAPIVMMLGAIAANLGRIVDRLDTLIELQRPKPSRPQQPPKPRSMPGGDE